MADVYRNQILAYDSVSEKNWASMEEIEKNKIICSSIIGNNKKINYN